MAAMGPASLVWAPSPSHVFEAKELLTASEGQALVLPRWTDSTHPVTTGDPIMT